MPNNKPVTHNKWIWLSVLILVISLSVTTFLLAEWWLNFLPDDSGAIDLVPGLEVSDDQAYWATRTQLDIFRISYEDGQHKITVLSSDGTKVIAPGTSNSYTFKLKNNGVVPMDYRLALDAYVTPGDVSIPILARLRRHDSHWVLGDAEHGEGIPALDATGDSATLGIGKFVCYTLDWRWPFESGDDAYDTFLGNIPKDEPVTFTIVISTSARASYTSDCDIGILAPHTNYFHLGFWLTLSAAALLTLVILVLVDKRRHLWNRQKAPEEALPE